VYAYVYNQSTESVALEADVTFDSNGPISAGITHQPGTAGIVLTEAGTYEVSFSVSGTEPNQIALFDGSVAVPGAIYGSGAGTQQNNGQVIFTASAGDTLTIRNHTSTAAVSLDTPIGGGAASVNASVVIQKLN
jgi:hypothetical protein